MPNKELSSTSFAGHESLSINGFDYVEFYTGNARQAEHFYCSTFGFETVAYAGIETGLRDHISYVLQLRNIRIVLTSALESASPVSEHVKLHGDGIKDIAFSVNDAALLFEHCVGRGALPILEPTAIEDKNGKIIKATVGTFGDTVHSFVQRESYNGVFFPTYSPINSRSPSSLNGLMSIDHIAVCLQEGDLDRWVSFYEEVFNFHQSHQEDVSTEYSAMNSKVVQSRNGSIKFPMMEPAHGKRESQIQEYLKFYGGPGVQHIALLSEDIAKSVQELRANGIDFLSAPESYYASVENSLGLIEESIELIRRHSILIDGDERGYLMQIFTKPLQGRPTLFFEIIYRNGATGFGSGNIRALFEAIEREIEHQTAV